MKKSIRYQLAMMAVLVCNEIEAQDKLEIIETLMGDKSLAEWSEKQEEKKNGESV